MYDEEEPTLRNIARELTTKGYLSRARKRNSTSKTWWDLVFLPIGFGAIGFYAFAFGISFLWLHTAVYPADTDRLRDLHRLLSGSFTAFVAVMDERLNFDEFLMFIVPAIGAVPLGLMTSNALMWLVPPARRASEEKAKGRKWATFRGAQMGLFKVALVLVPIAVASGIIGATLLGR